MSAADHVRSWYVASANPHPRYPALADRQRCDVVVVGGGYTGLSTALNLAERGYDVALLEARRIGWGASGRNGGQIVTAYNRSMADVAGRVGAAAAHALWDLAQEAQRIIAERVARHDIACDLRWGWLLAAIKRRHVEELKALLAEWRDYGYEAAELVEGAAVADWVACRHYRAVLVDRGGGHLHPLNYALGLASAAAAAGVRIFEETPVERLTVGPRPCAHTPRGLVEADHAVLACNAYLDRLTTEAVRQVRPYVMPVATHMLATAPLGADRMRQVIPSGYAVSDMNFVLDYFKPASDHRLLFGGRADYSGRQLPRDPSALRRRMLRCFPGLADVAIDYAWGGHVAITINRLPHLGRLTGDVYFAQGFSGQGVALTGIAGAVIAEAIAGTAERFDVFARIPHARFPGGRPLRMPALVLAMAWARLRDML